MILALGCFSLRQLCAGTGDTDAPPTEPDSTREYFTGDWNGLRDALGERGVVFTLTYAADVIGVACGGIKRGLFYNGLLDLGTDIDLGRLIGWYGGHFHVNGLYPHGENGSASYVGHIGTFSNIEAYDAYRLL